MKLLMLIAVLFIGCKKESFLEQDLKSVPRELYTAQSHNGIIPQEILFKNILPQVIQINYQYDSVYVTFLPHRTGNDSIYDSQYTVVGQVFMVFHFFSPKQNFNSNAMLIYDPQGDSTTKYMASRWD